MHDAVAEWRGADPPLLGFVNDEIDIALGAVAEISQFAFKFYKVVGHLVFKTGGGRFAAFAFGSQPKGEQQIRPISNL